MNAVTLSLAITQTIVETLATNDPFVDTTKNTITHTGLNTSQKLSAFTTPNAQGCALFQKAMSSGAATIDLTALTGSNGITVDATGKKVCYAYFHNPATNSGSITITFGAANPYLLKGTGWKVILAPGDAAAFPCFNATAATTPAVDGTHKNIDIAGTGTEALDVELVFGT